MLEYKHDVSQNFTRAYKVIAPDWVYFPYLSECKRLLYKNSSKCQIVSFSNDKLKYQNKSSYEIIDSVNTKSNPST